MVSNSAEARYSWEGNSHSHFLMATQHCLGQQHPSPQPGELCPTPPLRTGTTQRPWRTQAPSTGQTMACVPGAGTPPGCHSPRGRGRGHDGFLLHLLCDPAALPASVLKRSQSENVPGGEEAVASVPGGSCAGRDSCGVPALGQKVRQHQWWDGEQDRGSTRMTSGAVPAPA